jgi:hypothetical protein
MNQMKPIINKRYKLEKFPGKGGWTFARIPEIIQDKTKPFGWVKVKGSIDGYEIRRCHLMPMGEGKLFLAVKSEIRKRIRKKEGDSITVTLYPDNDPLEIPEEIMFCLKDEPKALTFFKSLSESEQSFYIQWIGSSKRIETKVNRLTMTVNRLARGLKMHDKI